MGKLTIDATLRPYQYDFVFAKERFPALFAGWGTGKTMAGIFAIMEQCKKFKNNLFAVYRKEGNQLEKSTIEDWRLYTGGFQNMKYNIQSKTLEIPAFKAKGYFLHADTLSVVNNLNLGAVLIEQADEIDDNGQAFDMIDGRTRRQGTGRKVFVIGNTTDENHWVYRYFKSGVSADGVNSRDDRFRIWEANSFDNAQNLPADTIESWKKLKDRNPAVYRRYVMNEWGIGDDQFVVITSAELDALMLVRLPELDTRKIISCDPSTGGDECVCYYFEGPKVVDVMILHERDTMKIAASLAAWGTKKDCHAYCGDCIGAGAGVFDRLNEISKENTVYRISSAEKARDDRFPNLRAELWWTCGEKVKDKAVAALHDPELKRQLTSVRFKMPAGKIQLERKDETKKRLRCSPDRADAYVYGIYGLGLLPAEEPKDIWAKAEQRKKHDEPSKDWMAV